MKHRFLSVDGGGCRAYIALAALKYVEAQTKRPCVELFDTIAGTSTGAIIALALTKPRPLSAAEIEAFYDENLPRIFKRRWQSYLNFGLVGPKYDAGVLEGALKSVLGETPMTMHGKAFVLATAMDIAIPQMFWGTPKWAAWEVARASSAAPTYFDVFVKNGIAYWDGGCVGGNNSPANTALEMLGVEPENALILSLGTGTAKEGWGADQVKKWYTLEVISPLLTLLMDASTIQVNYNLQHVMPYGQYLRLQTTIQNAAMDDVSPSNIKALKTAGQALVEARRAELDAFIERLEAGT